MLPRSAAFTLALFAIGLSSGIAQRTSPPNETSETSGPESLPATLPVEPLASCDWLQGEPVNQFEPDRLYLIECWATVSEPSTSRIPYLNDLDARFRPRGLRVVGVAVGEANRQLIANFVTNHQPTMEYPVAFAGAEGPFLRQWLATCGVTEVPHAFLLRNGELLLSAPAGHIHDAMIAGLLSGSISPANLQREIENRVDSDTELAEAAAAFDTADRTGDIEGMRSALRRLENIGVRELVLQRCRFLIAVQNGQSGEALAMIEDAAVRAESQQLMYLFQYSIALTIRPQPLTMKREIWSALEREVTEHLEGAANHLQLLEALCRLRWDLGNREGAAEIARRMALAAATEEQFAWAYERFAAEVENGEMPSHADLTRRMSSEAQVEN